MSIVDEKSTDETHDWFVLTPFGWEQIPRAQYEALRAGHSKRWPGCRCAFCKALAALREAGIDTGDK